MILATGAYDPSDPDERPPSRHLSKKDLRNLAVGICLLFLLMWPLYSVLKANSERHLCSNNFKAISTAMGLYMSQNDDRFPPVFHTTDALMPLADSKGRPFTWSSLLDQYMSERANFICPSASEEESVQAQAGRSSATLPTTYGMYYPYGGYYKESISNISQIALIAETSNNGANDTYDPIKYLAPDGSPSSQDGFAIGFDTDPFAPTPESRAVTRLAFPGTSGGGFDDTGRARHRDGIFVLFGDLRLGVIKPGTALLQKLKSGEIVGPWAVPADRL